MCLGSCPYHLVTLPTTISMQEHPNLVLAGRGGGDCDGDGAGRSTGVSTCEVLSEKLTPACFSLQGPKGDRGSPGEKVGDTGDTGDKHLVAWALMACVFSRASVAKMVWGCLVPPAPLVPLGRSLVSQVKM